FDIDITYIKGKLNKVADCLSQYYESDTLMDTHQPHKYVQADVCIDPAGDNLPGQWYREAPSISEKIPENPTPSSYGDNITLAEMLFKQTSNATLTTWGNEEFIKQIQSGYKDDKLFAHILEKPGEYTDFEVKDDLIWQKNQQSIEVVCIPCNRGMIMQVLDQAHTILGHFGDQWTNEYTQ
ncbi:hypothetical protein L208DRAFT_1271034, partial [Tricholoma matsutake]